MLVHRRDSFAGVEQTLRVGDEVARRLAGQGPGVFEVPGLMSVVPLRRCVARKVYHRGFIDDLTLDPRAAVLSIVDETYSWMGTRRHLGAAHVGR